VVPDLSRESTARARWAGRARLRSAVAFPLALADRFEGVIEFLAPDIHEPDAEVAALFATVGGQLAQYLSHHDRGHAWPDAVAAAVVVLGPDGVVEHANARARALGVQARLPHGIVWELAPLPGGAGAVATATSGS
jgi:hypothetical protein